ILQMWMYFNFFFFQAEDGIRDFHVTGVQTCALPIFYKSVWNKRENTLHVLPHWTWPERIGQVTPVFVYTNYPSAELFINGKSQGVRRKTEETVQHRYRLMWTDVIYEPGELKVVAYDQQGKLAEEKIVRTAGKAHQI